MRVNLRIFSLIAILLITSTALVFANDSKVSVIINNQPVTYSNETGYPFIDSKGRTQVPFRQTMTAFGCTVDWNKETQTAVAIKDGIKVEVPIGKTYILKDGANVPNDTSAVIINGKTYLPIAIVLRSFGAEVKWDGNNHSVKVNSLQAQFINSQDLDKYEEFVNYYKIETEIDDTNKTIRLIDMTNGSKEEALEYLHSNQSDLEYYIKKIAKNYESEDKNVQLTTIIFYSLNLDTENALLSTRIGVKSSNSNWDKYSLNLKWRDL